MKIRMTKTMAGPAGCAREGEVVEAATADAYDLIEAGAAEQIETVASAKPKSRGRKKAKAAPETAATEGAPETAANPQGGGDDD